MYKFTDFFKFTNEDETKEDEESTQSGGVGILHKIRQYDHNMQRAGSLEKHEYKEHENKVVPFSLFYDRPNQIRSVGGDQNDVPVISEEMHNKLFFSVANEINENGNRKTRKNYANK
jgi:hypothetical protein